MSFRQRRSDFIKTSGAIGTPLPITDIFQPNQPDQARYAAVLNQNIYQVEPPKRLESPVVTAPQLYEYKLSQPEPQQVSAWLNSSLYQQPNITGPQDQLSGATSQQTSIFQPNQPEWNRFLFLLNQNRFMVEVIKRFEGATSQQTYIFPPNQPEPTRVTAYLTSGLYLVAAPIRLDGATSQQTFPVPPISQPEFTYYRRITPAPEQFRPIEGATLQQTYLFYPAQPEFTYYRLVTPAVVFRPIEGATLQQTFIFPVSQPDMRQFVRSLQPDLVRVLDQASAQTFEFPLSQPVAKRILDYLFQNSAIVEPVKQTTGATTQQTYVFQPNQPEYRYYVSRLNQLISLPKQFDGFVTPPVTGVFDEQKYYIGAVLTVYTGESAKIGGAALWNGW